MSEQSRGEFAFDPNEQKREQQSQEAEEQRAQDERAVQIMLDFAGHDMEKYLRPTILAGKSPEELVRWQKVLSTHQEKSAQELSRAIGEELKRKQQLPPGELRNIQMHEQQKNQGALAAMRKLAKSGAGMMLLGGLQFLGMGEGKNQNQSEGAQTQIIQGITDTRERTREVAHHEELALQKSVDGIKNGTAHDQKNQTLGNKEKEQNENNETAQKSLEQTLKESHEYWDQYLNADYSEEKNNILMERTSLESEAIDNLMDKFEHDEQMKDPSPIVRAVTAAKYLQELSSAVQVDGIPAFSEINGSWKVGITQGKILKEALGNGKGNVMESDKLTDEMRKELNTKVGFLCTLNNAGLDAGQMASYIEAAQKLDLTQEQSQKMARFVSATMRLDILTGTEKNTIENIAPNYEAYDFIKYTLETGDFDEERGYDAISARINELKQLKERGEKTTGEEKGVTSRSAKLNMAIDDTRAEQSNYTKGL